MRIRPDLSFPALPDAAEMDLAQHRKMEAGGLSLREEDQYQWPESGPSESSTERGLDTGAVDDDAPLVGPFEAKLAAAMTGAVVTSLLSKSLTTPPRHLLLLTCSDPFRRAQDPAPDGPTPPTPHRGSTRPILTVN